MPGWLTEMFRRIVSGLTSATAPSEPVPPLDRDALYRRQRKYAHECGHAVLAWLSPAVHSVMGVTFLRGGDAHTTIAFRSAHSDYEIEAAVVLMGGLAGELLLWRTVRSGGFADDLPKAIGVLEAYFRKGSLAQLERRWQGRIAESSLDVAAMMAERPSPELAAGLNLAFRRAKRLLIEHRAPFDRLVALALRKGDLSEKDIASRFGPRVWARR